MNDITNAKELKKKRRKEIKAKKKQEQITKLYRSSFLRNDKSRAHSIFCEKVYGKNLCQVGMMDMVQLTKLLEVLNLSSRNRVIDLGCATGRISEYISDTTGAYVLGIDIMEGAILSAQNRTREKRIRLDFQEGNINNLSLDPACVDTIIVIDSIYFLDIPLELLIKQLKNFLMQGGQMGIFYSEHIGPRRIKLERVLKNLNLSFQTWNFTDSEHDIWLKQAQVLEELHEDFIAEGNTLGYTMRKLDYETWLPFLEDGKGNRQLFHVQLV